MVHHLRKKYLVLCRKRHDLFQEIDEHMTSENDGVGCIGEQIAVVPVPQILKEIVELERWMNECHSGPSRYRGWAFRRKNVEAVKMSSRSASRNVCAQLVDEPVPQILEEIVEQVIFTRARLQSPFGHDVERVNVLSRNRATDSFFPCCHCEKFKSGPRCQHFTMRTQPEFGAHRYLFVLRQIKF